MKAATSEPRKVSPSPIPTTSGNSPLVVGIGEGETFLGSDVAAFIGYTREALELGQDQIVTITTRGASIINVDWDAASAQKGGFPNFMAKEIHDQPHAVADTLLGRTDESGALVLDELRMDEAE